MYANPAISLDLRRILAFTVAFAVELILVVAFIVVILAPGTTVRPGSGPDRPAPPTIPSQLNARGGI